MHRLHLDNPADVSNTEARWMGMPRGSDAVSIYHGFWTNDHPDVTSGACVRVTIDDDQFYDYSWQFVSCEMTLPFVCEAAAGVQGANTIFTFKRVLLMIHVALLI